MNTTRVVAKNTFFQFIGRAVNLLLSIFLVGYLTRYLGVSGYGQYTTIFAFLAIAAAVFDFGFITVLIRDSAKSPEKTEKIYSNILSLRLITGIFFIIISSVISLFMPYPDIIKWGIIIGSIATFFTLLNLIPVGILQANLYFGKAVISDTVGKILTFLLTIVIGNLGGGLLGIVLVTIVGNFITALITFLLIKNIVKLKLSFDFSFWKNILVSSIPIGFASLLYVLFYRMDSVFLSVFKPMEAVGIYGVSYKIFDILLIFPPIFMASVFPLLSQASIEKNRITRLTQKSFEVMLIIALPMLVSIIFLAKPLIELISGPDFTLTITFLGYNFAGAAGALQILVIGAFFAFISQVFLYVLISTNFQRIALWINLVLFIFNISLNIILIPYLSFIGAALVASLTHLVGCILIATFAIKRNSITLDLSIVFKVLLSTMGMGIVLWFLIPFNWMFAFVISIVVYLIFLVITRSIKKQTILQIINKEQR